MTELVHITGAKELEAALKQLPDYIAKRVATNAVMAGATIIKNEAELRAPRDTGFLSEHIIRRANKQSEHSVTVEVGPSKKAFWGLFQEFGTSKMRAMPWLRPAWESKKMAALDAIGKKLGAGIELAAKKLAGPLRKSGLR